MKWTAAEEEKIAALARMRTLCPNYLFEKHFYIKDMRGKERPVGKGGLKLAQRKLLAVIQHQRAARKPVRVLVGKSRKQGVTTITSFDCLDRVFEDQLDAIIIAHNKLSTNKIFDIYRRAYRHYKLPKPALHKGKTNLREMRFEEGHDGHILIETANNIYAGTGETPQYIGGSELAKWDRGRETLISLLQAMGDEEGTTFIGESTFNGEEDCFLPLWKAAYDNSRISFTEDEKGELVCHFEVTNAKEWNGWIALFISVLDDDTARLPIADEGERLKLEQSLDAYERTAIDKHGASLEYIKWRRWVKKHKSQRDEEIQKQEWCMTYEEAVSVTGRPRFNIEMLDAHMIEEGTNGGLSKKQTWDREVIWTPDPQELLTRFRGPEHNHRYVCGWDIASGEIEETTQQADNIVGHAYDIDAGMEQVMSFESRMTMPEDSIPIVMLVGEYYNMSFIVIERNGQGDIVCLGVRDAGYPEYLLFHQDDWKPGAGMKRAIGFKTGPSTRNMLIKAVANAINNNEVIFHDKRTVMEHKRFVYKPNGRIEAARGYKDDHVVAHGLAEMGRDRAAEMKRGMDRFASAQAQASQEEARRTADQSTGY